MIKVIFIFLLISLPSVLGYLKQGKVGVPIESVVQYEKVDSYVFSSNDVKQLFVQISVVTGQLQFAIHKFCDEIDVSELTLGNYNWHSGMISSSGIQTIKLEEALKDVEYASKLQNKILISLFAHKKSRFILLTAKERVELPNNLPIHFLLQNKNDKATFVITSNKLFKLATSATGGDTEEAKIKMKLTKQNSEEPSIYEGLIYQQKIIDIDAMTFSSSQIQNESQQILTKEGKNSYQVFLVEVESQSQLPVSLVMEWTPFKHKAAPIQYEKYHERFYEFLIGYSIPKGKQAIKIGLMICAMISFLVYAISIYMRNGTKYEFIPSREQYQDNVEIE